MKKPQPAEEKCYRCRQNQSRCDGTYPFAQKCSSCQKTCRKCTAEKPEKPGLPKHQKCQPCANNRNICVGEPPFQDKCAFCKARNSKCYAQGIEVPKSVPDEEKCMSCKKKRTCDGKKPCTACTTCNKACSYKDGNAKWTYQTDPEKWKTPTSPDCRECRQYNQTHLGKSLLCDGKFPCSCCLEEQVKTYSSNCTYHYENGVSKFWKLEGENAQELRKKEKSRRDGRRDERQKRIRREIKVQNAQGESKAEDEDLLDEGLLLNDTGYKDNSQSDSDHDSNQENDPDSANDSDHDDDDSDAGGDAGNKHPNKHYNHDHQPDQGETADSPDDQDPPKKAILHWR